MVGSALAVCWRPLGGTPFTRYALAVIAAVCRTSMAKLVLCTRMCRPASAERHWLRRRVVAQRHAHGRFPVRVATYLARELLNCCLNSYVAAACRWVPLCAVLAIWSSLIVWVLALLACIRTDSPCPQRRSQQLPLRRPLLPLLLLAARLEHLLRAVFWKA